MIWKYEIGTGPSTVTLHLPKGFSVILVGMQRGVVCMWIKFPSYDQNDLVPVEVSIVGTGAEAPYRSDHAGSVLSDPEGTWVWHVFLVWGVEQWRSTSRPKRICDGEVPND